MKIRHKKIFISGVAAVTAGVLGVGALLHTSVSVLASSAMMPGIETIVNETSGAEPFRILEVADTRKDAELGYYVSGQEPCIKLYEYTPEGSSEPVRFSTLEEGLAMLPTGKLREEFAKNVKLDEEGKIDPDGTQIRNVLDQSYQTGVSEGDEISGYPLSYSEYREKYFLEDTDTAQDWRRVDFAASEQARTDLLSGHYEENTSGTGDYTKAEQSYYPVRNNVEEDENKSGLYRENILNFFYSESEEGAAAPYYPEFEAVSNSSVRDAIQDPADGGQVSILPEYDYANGKYGYYEKVYGVLTTDTADDVKAGSYTFPGENPKKSEDAVLIQKNEAATGPDAFSSGSDDVFSEEIFDQENKEDFQTDPGEEQPSEDDFGAEEFISDGSEGQVSEVPVPETQSQNTDEFFSDAGDLSAETEIHEDLPENPDDAADITEGSGAAAGVDDGTSGDSTGNTAPEIQAVYADEVTRGSQENPTVYLGESIGEYPNFKYTPVGDFKYVTDSAQAAEESDRELTDNGQPVVRRAGDITRADGQYWYWIDDGSGSCVRRELSVVTGFQPVAYSDIHVLAEDLPYDYYYRVNAVYFCCRMPEDGDAANPEAFRYFGWYYPSYPQNEDIYLPVQEGQVGTAYISDASYSLTPGSGNYDFIPGTEEGDSTYEVQVNHLFYQGGYTNHDWLKRYVFHLSPEDEDPQVRQQFADFDIQVDTLTAEEFAQTYGGQAAAEEEKISGENPAQDVSEEEAEQFNAGETAEQETAEETGSGDYGDGQEAEVEPMVSEAMEELVAMDAGTDFSSGEEAFTDDFSSGGDGQTADETDPEDETFTAGEAELFSSGEADTAGAAEAAAAQSLAEYDLIYVNGQLTAESARALADSGVPCILNQDKLSEGAKAALAPSIKAEDADKCYVSQRYYFFRNTVLTTADGTAGSALVNLDFHTNVNVSDDGELTSGSVPDAVLGFEEILEYIESENQYRKIGSAQSSGEGFGDGEAAEETVLLGTDISQARAVEYILNYQYRRALKTKEQINVLEIQPAQSSPQVTRERVLSWLYGTPEIEEISACCYHLGEGTDKLTDGKSETIWHSAYAYGDYNLKHSGEHQLKIRFSGPSKVAGFRYCPRQSGENGRIRAFTVRLYDEAGNVLYEGTGKFENSSQWQTFEFKQAYSGVSFAEIVADEAVNGFASGAELGFYGDLPMETPKVNIKTMTSSEYVGHIDDINSKYDLIYLGDNCTQANRQNVINGEAPLMYAHVGAAVLANTQDRNDHLGLMDFDRTTDGSGLPAIKDVPQTEGGTGSLRGSGNDITNQQYKELMDFVKSGYPVVIGDGLVTGTGSEMEVDAAHVDNSSCFYKFLAEAKDYENVMAEDRITQDGNLSFFMNLSKPVINFDIEGGVKPPQPASLDADIVSGGEGFIEDEGLEYVFRLENDSEISPANATYDCQLYLDLNFDGNLADSEEQEAYIEVVDLAGNEVQTTDETGHYRLRIGREYRVTRKIPADYFKIITWKLQICSNSNSSVRTSVVGYAKRENTGEPAHIKVLQIAPNTSTRDAQLPGTWDLSYDSSKKAEYLTDQYNGRFQQLLARVDDFAIDITLKRIGKADTNGNYAAGTYVGDYLSALEQGTNLLDEYDMLIIGFDDVYEDIPNLPDVEGKGAVDAIYSFIQSGKSVIFAHDTTSFINRDYNQYGDRTASGTPIKGVWQDRNTWGYHLNSILRPIVGLDRYGITSELNTTADGNTTTIGALLRGQGAGTRLGGSQTDYSALERLVGDVAYAAGDNKQSSYLETQGFSNWELMYSGATETTSAAKINDGAVTQYPYTLGDLTTTETHGQYYQLSLEKDYDINGFSDGRNDIVVWYCLSGDNSYYAVSPNDVRNSYYFYSCGNVIYTGVGHKIVEQASGNQTEKKLFVNAIIAAASVTAVSPEVKFAEQLNPGAAEETLRYYMTDQADFLSKEEGNVLEKDMEFYFNVKDYNMISSSLSLSDQKQQDMTAEFFVEDENGSFPATGEGETAPEVKLQSVDNEIEGLTQYGDNNSVIVKSSDGKFHLPKNNAYGFKLPDMENYLRDTSGRQYKTNCRLYVRVTSYVYLYGKPVKKSTWAVMDLKQRQLFDLD